MGRSYGILTEAQREHMSGERDIDDLENPWQMKKRIRESIRQSQEDLHLLNISPHWTQEDAERIVRETGRPNSKMLKPINPEFVEAGVGSVKEQSKIYGDSVKAIAEALENLDVDSDWDDESVQELFVKQVVRVWKDAFKITGEGVNNEEAIRELFTEMWPEREKALSVIEKELSGP